MRSRRTLHNSVTPLILAGLRFFGKQTADEDRRSYLYYNMRCSFDCKLCLNERLNGCPFLQIWLAAAQVAHILYQ
jgi:hypothetical protein